MKPISTTSYTIKVQLRQMGILAAVRCRKLRSHCMREIKATVLPESYQKVIENEVALVEKGYTFEFYGIYPEDDLNASLPSQMKTIHSLYLIRTVI